MISHSGYAGTVDTVLPSGHRDTVGGLFGATKVTRLEVRPGAGSREQQWLTVFDAARTSGGAQRVEPLATSGVRTGVLLHGPRGRTAVLLGDGSTRTARYQLPSGSTFNLLTGVTPGAAYAVRTTGHIVDVHVGAGPRRADASGTLAFTTQSR